MPKAKIVDNVMIVPREWLTELSKKWMGPCCTCGLPSWNIMTKDGRTTSVRCPCKKLQ